MKTFRIGGVHPAENKLSAAEPIKVAELPKVAVFPMGQHIGAPAVPIVQKGDKVKVGTQIAKPMEKALSTSIFSSVSGTVLKVDTVVDASGYKKPAVYITVEGDEWEESIDRTDKLVTLKDKPELTPEEIIEKVKNAGIVGLGGACFPTHVKLMPPPQFKPEWVIINAVECEPYLTADHRLLDREKLLLQWLPVMQHPSNIEKLFDMLRLTEPRRRLDFLLRVESLAAGFVLLRTLRFEEHDRELLIATCRQLMRRGTSESFNMACLIREFFGLEEVRGTFSLRLEPYEMTCVDTDFDTFCRLVHKVR